MLLSYMSSQLNTERAMLINNYHYFYALIFFYPSFKLVISAKKYFNDRKTYHRFLKILLLLYEEKNFNSVNEQLT